MSDAIFDFLNRHLSFVITTHDSADADGLGAEKVILQTIRTLGKKARVINSSPIPEKFKFMDPGNFVENWEDAKKSLPPDFALLIVDTADEYMIGDLREIIPAAAEVFVIDHHEPVKFNNLGGYIDNTSSSTSEMAVEFAAAAGIRLTDESAAAAYAGIAYDTGFFAYPKTTSRTFRAALALVDAGVNPSQIYRELRESASTGALLLQKLVLSTLVIHNEGRVAAQILRKGDLENSGAYFEDAENLINIPMKSKSIEVSIMIKENSEGQIRCSLRSKGKVNVSKIAQQLGGGGHVTAAGFKSSCGAGETLTLALGKVSRALENI